MGINWIQKPITEIKGRDCVIWIQSRPHYCDRGNYLANVNANSGSAFALDLDSQDAWPRYYFDFEVAKKECEAWLKTRGQFVEGNDWEEIE